MLLVLMFKIVELTSKAPKSWLIITLVTIFKDKFDHLVKLSDEELDIVNSTNKNWREISYMDVFNSIMMTVVGKLWSCFAVSNCMHNWIQLAYLDKIDGIRIHHTRLNIIAASREPS